MRAGCRPIEAARPALRQEAADHLDFKQEPRRIAAIRLVIRAFDRKARTSGEHDEAHCDWHAVEREHIRAANRIRPAAGESIERKLFCFRTAGERGSAFSFPAACLNLEECRHRAIESLAGAVTLVCHRPDLFKTAPVTREIPAPFWGEVSLHVGIKISAAFERRPLKRV